MKETVKILGSRFSWLKTERGFPVRIAIQDGRLLPIAWKVLAIALQSAGLALPKGTLEQWKESNNLVFSPKYLSSVKIFRTKDPSLCVGRGIADYAFTGSDELEEQNLQPKAGRYNTPYIWDALEGGKTSLMLQTPPSSRIKTPERMRGRIVASKYPSLTEEYFRNKKIKLKEIIAVRGKVEGLANPELGAVDAITDLVETGTAMRANRLRPIAKLGDFGPVFIGQRPLPDRATWRE